MENCGEISNIYLGIYFKFDVLTKYRVVTLNPTKPEYSTRVLPYSLYFLSTSSYGSLIDIALSDKAARCIDS